jgi:lipopolysaccharide export LptBFGC system permease protein LptF
MKNLRELGKKLSFNTMIIKLKQIGGTLPFIMIIFGLFILTVGASFLLFFNIQSVQQYNLKQQKDSIINVYNMKIAKQDSINKQLQKQQIVWQQKIDSLTKEQDKLIIEYAKKIETITNATATEHALWLDTITKQLDSLKK